MNTERESLCASLKQRLFCRCLADWDGECWKVADTNVLCGHEHGDEVTPVAIMPSGWFRPDASHWATIAEQGEALRAAGSLK